MSPFLIMAMGGGAALAVGVGVHFMRVYAVTGESERWYIPEETTPNGGGLAILFVVLMTFMPLGMSLADPGQVVRFALAAALMASIGFFNDLRDIPRRWRLIAQVAAALIFIPAAPIRDLALPGVVLELAPLVGDTLAILWIVGLTNTFTYMDGINGLASGQAALAASLWMIIGLIIGNPMIALLGALIAGSAFSFSAYNLPPRSIFLGEAGGMFLGFSLAALPMFAASQSNMPRLIITGGMMMSLFCFDAVLTLTRYLIRGQITPRSERSHLYQRLVALGDSPRKVLTLYLALSLGFSIAGVVYWQSAAPALIISVVMVCLSLFAWIKRREVAPDLDASHFTNSPEAL